MSKALSKYNFEQEFNQVKRLVNSLGKTSRVLAKQKEVNTTGLTNKQIDEQIAGPAYNSEELNGVIISDPTNKLLLVRQENVWRKVKVE